MRGQFPLGEEHPHFVPCNTARQGHSSHRDFCRKQTSVPEMCEKQGARSTGKKGKELEQAPLEQGYSTDLTTPSHQQGAYEAPPSANMPKKVLFPMPLDTVALPGRV